MGDRACERTLVTGGCGYIGATLVAQLLRSGVEVRAFDSLAHGQQSVAEELRAAGAEVICADIRDTDARRGALDGVHAVVHLAAIVGDPACARDPELAEDVNVRATHALIEDAAAAGARRFVFASTCSNYGRMRDATVPIAEEGELRPVSLYAEQKVAIERLLLGAARADPLTRTCLRFATVYGVARRMRFDLTVNEFARELWGDRELQVYGEQFWRPYIHVRDAARAVRAVLEAPVERIAGEVFNAGRSGENYRKADLVRELRRVLDRGTVSFVRREEDPRDYKVSFEKIATQLGFQTEMTVPDGIAEVLAALDAGAFDPDPFDERYLNLRSGARA